ncbi:unnamed protein product [Rotaria sp. Silwood2]|nr:unnamed protein product [Rotaria sp. Silwood2]CAF3068661.1 unnamed protein product [Rotaria sp. Silwood2]CAF3313152.1 unnamed protein product [Rotaria sp. Silwood2]CAF4266989.1 unnamed protein product [Rotaria sp. Silwood2]CAF4315943.1 unnamed protein product [Rotaria sp. Silwood2]
MVCSNSSTLITFNDLTLDALLPDYYYSINWTNALIHTTMSNTSGYYTAAVNMSTVLFNGYGDPMTMSSLNNKSLTLYSAIMASAWRDNLQLTVAGYKSNALVAINNFILQVFTASYITFNGLSGLDNITFSTSNGTENPAVSGRGAHFAMDNLCLSLS